MAKKEILVAFGVDIDAVAGWLGSYGGEDSPDDISRGMFAGEVGVPRLLKLFKKYDLPATWFAPGHSIETFPEQMKMIVDAGHEIGAHGYSHENPIAMTPKQEEDILLRSIELITELTDSWTKIDYSAEASEWTKPLVRGYETNLVEIPANWYLDDLPPMMFVKKSPNSYGFANPRDIYGGLWQDSLDYCYREYDYAVFGMTIHPDVSGRPQCIMALERLIEYINSHEGIRWCTFDEIADDFIKRSAELK